MYSTFPPLPFRGVAWLSAVTRRRIFPLAAGFRIFCFTASALSKNQIPKISPFESGWLKFETGQPLQFWTIPFPKMTHHTSWPKIGFNNERK